MGGVGRTDASGGAGSALDRRTAVLGGEWRAACNRPEINDGDDVLDGFRAAGRDQPIRNEGRFRTTGGIDRGCAVVKLGPSTCGL